jgi:DNA-binding GntR family transcriptional regulator
MFEVMTEFEALCAGLAAARMTSAVRQALAGVHEDLRAIIYSGDPQRYHEINKAFHSTIYLGSHNSYLAELMLATRIGVQPFRRAQFRNLGRLSKSHVEHESIVTAILRGDHVAASTAVRHHIMTVRGEYESYALSHSV